MLEVGLGERTNREGLTFLERHFGTTFEIIPLQLAKTFLHLDVVVKQILSCLIR
jgi:N-dimethylarginine dimethylaminohydrolase